MSVRSPHLRRTLEPGQVLRVRPVAGFSPLAGNRWRVEVGTEPSELEGQHARDVLPGVLDAIDGRRSVESIATHLLRERAADPTLTTACLQRLYDWGFLDDAEGYRDLESGDPVADAQALFFALWSSYPRRVQGELNTARVVVIGNGAGPDHLCRSLERAGFQTPQREYPPGTSTCDLVVAWREALADRALVAANRDCLEDEIPLLVVIHNRALAGLGPLVAPRQSACLECALEHFGGLQDECSGGHFRPVPGPAVGILAELAAVEVIRFAASCLRPRCVGRQVQMVNTRGGLALTEVEILRRPRCRACGALVTHSPSISFQSGARDDDG